MSGQIPVKASKDGLVASAKAAQQGKGLPPVHLWNPPFTGEMDMRIARDGTWFHEGAPIHREALVRLFSTILRKDGDTYVLVTPVEKVRIEVEDAPFVAVDFDVSGEGCSQVLSFTTNVGDTAVASAENPIRVVRDAASDEPAPYVMVRAGLEARIDRKSFYRMVELGEHQDVEGQSWFGVMSGGCFFPMIPSGELD